MTTVPPKPVIEAPRSNVKELLALLATLEPIDVDFSIPDDPAHLDDVPDFGADDPEAPPEAT